MVMTRRLSRGAIVTYSLAEVFSAVESQEHPDVVMLPRYEARIDDPALPYVVEVTAALEHSRFICERLTCHRRPGGPPVTNELVRQIPVAAIISQTVDSAVHRKLDAETVGLAGPEDRQLVEDAARTLRRPPGRGRTADRQDLMRRVADRYRVLLADGDPRPRKTIAKETGYTNDYIGKLLSEARKTKPPLLGPALPGRAAEVIQQPKRHATAAKEKGSRR